MDKKIEQKVLTLRFGKPSMMPIMIKKELHLTCEVQVIRAICSKELQRLGQNKPSGNNSFKKELLSKAEKFWSQDENKSKTPDKSTLPYLLIPKYGMATTKALIYASIYLKKEKQLLEILLSD